MIETRTTAAIGSTSVEDARPKSPSCDCTGGKLPAYGFRCCDNGGPLPRIPDRDRGWARFVRVCVRRPKPWSPILSWTYFDFWNGGEDEAQSEARRRVDALLETNSSLKSLPTSCPPGEKAAQVLQF